MDWTITMREHYAVLVTDGVVDKDGSLAMLKAIAAALRETDIKRVLIDHRNISKVSGGAVDVYNRPKEFEAMGLLTNIKVAEVVNPEHKGFFDFLETVCVNRGYMFSIFGDEKAALEWLLQA